MIEDITYYSELKHQLGAKNIEPILSRIEECLNSALEELKKLAVDEDMAKKEPNSLKDIYSLRPKGPRRIWKAFDKAEYMNRVEGALLGRFAGCTLGEAVEFWDIERMEALAEENGEPFPPIDYWSYVPEPKKMHFNVSTIENFTRHKMVGVPVDDDLMYTVLGLLIVEENGPNFSTADVGKTWLKYLTWTWDYYVWANLEAGVPATEAAEKDNPKYQQLNALIRSDVWGYLAPGYPELAASIAWRDAYLSHRRNGIYSSMFFAAAVSAAFSVDDPVEALRIGLTEIPAESAFAENVRWALQTAPKVSDYREARNEIDSRFGFTNHKSKFVGMNSLHSINTSCCIIFGIIMGGCDFTKVIGDTVAIGMDNDCTAALAGSIVGAVVGKDGIPEHWYRDFNDVLHSSLAGKPQFKISDLIQRFTTQAEIMIKSN